MGLHSQPANKSGDARRRELRSALQRWDPDGCGALASNDLTRIVGTLCPGFEGDAVKLAQLNADLNGRIPIDSVLDALYSSGCAGQMVPLADSTPLLEAPSGVAPFSAPPSVAAPHGPRKCLNPASLAINAVPVALPPPPPPPPATSAAKDRSSVELDSSVHDARLQIKGLNTPSRSSANTGVVDHFEIEVAESHHVEPSVALRPKSALEDDFRVMNVVGTGKFGSVQIAKRLSNGELVAVKSMALEDVDEVGGRFFIENEVGIHEQLRHPNVVQLHALYEDFQRIHLVMEMCSGQNLCDFLVDRRRNLDLHTAAKFLEQIFSSVAYCHSLRICHRDIKPDNYVLSSRRPNASVKLIDFGLARMYQIGETMHSTVGSLRYTAPEVLEGNGYTEKCDIWSVGVVAFLMCTRRHCLLGSTDDEILESVKSGDVQWEPLEQRLRGAHPLKQMIYQLMAFDSGDRPTAQACIESELLQTAALTVPPARCCAVQ